MLMKSVNGIRILNIFNAVYPQFLIGYGDRSVNIEWDV